MMRFAILGLYVVAILGIVSIINGRGCDVGGECWFSVSRELPHYVATRTLGKNTLVAAGDIKLSEKLPAGAQKYSPALEDFVGKYLQSSIEKDQPITLLNVSAEPAITPDESRCLLSADTGAYASVVHLLKVGSRVSLACSPWGFSECGPREGTIVALLHGGAHGSSQALVAVDEDRCGEALTSSLIVGLPKPAPPARTP